MKMVITQLKHIALLAGAVLYFTACGNKSTTSAESDVTTEQTTDMAAEGQMQDTAMMGSGQMGEMMGHIHQDM